MKIDKNKNKKALWIDIELHKYIKIFAVEHDMNIEAATQLLIKLGSTQFKREMANDSA